MNKYILSILLLADLIGNGLMVSPVYAMDSDAKELEEEGVANGGITGKWVADGVMGVVSKLPMTSRLKEKYEYHVNGRKLTPLYNLGRVIEFGQFARLRIEDTLPEDKQEVDRGLNKLKLRVLGEWQGKAIKLSDYACAGDGEVVYEIKNRIEAGGKVNGNVKAACGEENTLARFLHGYVLCEHEDGVLKTISGMEVVTKNVGGKKVPVVYKGNLLFKGMHSNVGKYCDITNKEISRINTLKIEQLPTVNDVDFYPERAVWAVNLSAASIVLSTVMFLKWCSGKLFGSQEKRDKKQKLNLVKQKEQSGQTGKPGSEQIDTQKNENKKQEQNQDMHKQSQEQERTVQTVPRDG